MRIRHVTTKEIIKIHDSIIKASGGHGGIIAYGNLDFAVAQMRVPKSLERKVAILFFGLLTSHPFIDGNKRTALEAMKTFLYLNGKKFKATEKDIWIVLHDISEGNLNLEQTVKWIKKRVV